MSVNAKARVVQLTGFRSISAAAEDRVTFGRCFSWWGARLCVGGAQVQLRGTAGGPVCRPYDTARPPWTGGSWTRPYGGNRTRERWLNKLRRGPGTAPGANFANPGPSGPAGIQTLTQILRAGNVLPIPRGNPRKWGPGKGDYEHNVLIWSRSLSPLSLRDISP